MNKRILITSTDVMFWLFLLPHAKNLIENGYEVIVACIRAESFASEDYIKKIGNELPETKVLSISGSRRPLRKSNIVGLKQIRNLIYTHKIDIVWCNEPVVGIISRLATSFTFGPTKVVYFAHGLHFFRGGPLKHWCLFPIEWFASLLTDMIVLINRRDYMLVKKFFPVKSVYIPGIGFNIHRFREVSINKSYERQKLGISDDDFLMLAVGELNNNKNHILILRAVKKINSQKLKLLICGVGENYHELQEYVRSNKMEDSVHLLGLRNDVDILLNCADVFVHPSLREGLGIAPLEAMASGLPIITSDRHGLRDYSIDGVTGFVINDLKDPSNLVSIILKCMSNQNNLSKIGLNNRQKVEKFGLESVKLEILTIFEKLGGRS